MTDYLSMPLKDLRATWISCTYDNPGRAQDYEADEAASSHPWKPESHNWYVSLLLRAQKEGWAE